MTQVYDEIIVGSGSAGATIAARLTEDPSRNVLLLEAGPDFPTEDETPHDLLDGHVMSLSAHDWKYRADIMDGRRIIFPRGKATGGSSGVGAVIALRGTPRDFGEWAEAGNTEWAWDKVLPYYRKLEDDIDFGGTDVHGSGGPVPIRRWQPDELLDMQRAFVESCVAAGYPETKDQNDPEGTGVGSIPMNRRGMTRVSTALAYLSTARHRANLTIRAGVTVHRVLFEGAKAVGVELSVGGTVEQVYAKRIVLSAGAVGSPSILLRSGIGPADDLRRLGVDVRADLAGVGGNLIDHPRTGVFMVPKPNALETDEPFLQMILRTTAPGSEKFNDMQYYMVNHFDLTLFPELQMLSGGMVIHGVMVVDQQCEARGRLTLKSTDPDAAPEIELNFLQTERDLEKMVDGVRTAWQLVNHPDIRDKGERFIVLTDKIIENDAMVRQYVKTSLDSAYHPVGTARMGSADDAGAVVDQYARVHGIESLYVADASIMPSIVSCNTNMTSIMIGERVADWLKAV